MNYFIGNIIENSYLILGSIVLIATLFVVSAKNPIHRIASLIVVFTAGAFIFMLLDFYFLGLTYIIVYVGAIAILFLFVIMMVHIPSGIGNPIFLDDIVIDNDEGGSISSISSSSLPGPLLHRESSPLIINMPYRDIPSLGYTMAVSIIVVIFLIFIIFMPIASNLALYSHLPMDIYSYFFPIWSIEYKTLTDIESLAIIVYVAYPTALILISIALWTVMIGIISICSSRP